MTRPEQLVRLIAVLCIAVVCLTARAALPSVAFSDETLHYKVKYKWGLIHKQAGQATLTLRDDGGQYIAQLTAASEPWADKFYCVRDTLNGRIASSPFRPLFYEKIAHEGSDYKHDTVTFSYGESAGDSITGFCTRHVEKKDRQPLDQSLTLKSGGMTVDMLSAFYYMRSLPYDTMRPGQDDVLTIFSGKRKETLTITYHGIEYVKAEKSSYKCYHITFTFTSNGKKKTSDDMDAWISTGDRRIPIRLEGKLPVGKIHCIYTGN